jgi:hypothetical protein
MMVFFFATSLLLLLLSVEAIPAPQPGGGSSGAGIVLRVRLADGSMEKVQLEEGSEETLTLGEVLKPFCVPSGSSVRIGASTTKDAQKNLKALSIKHGSLLTVLPPKSDSQKPNGLQKGSRKPKVVREWDPYPDLAKDYDSVVLKNRRKRSSSQGMSYSDISKLQSSLHVVDPQKEGPIKRLYMCRVSAERFYSNGATTNKKTRSTTFECRFGLLLGTISKERVDRRPKKARTSLSSQTSDSEYCSVAKVQAVWEPPGQTSRVLSPSDAKSKESGTTYDAPMAASLLAKNPKVLEIAKCLGLAPVGWIFSYQDDRLAEENSFGTDGPQALFGLDVAVGGALKIQSMKDKHDHPDGENGEATDDLNVMGDKFVTLAMDATTGATEAFQLSDVSVQMVHEDIFEPVLEPVVAAQKPQPKAKGKSKKPKIVLQNPPVVPTKHPVLVDGRETSLLDSVLCLVNTAVLSHSGSYCGSSGGNPTKKSNGGLTNKTKKALAKALDSPESNDFLKLASDFSVLLALDELLASSSGSKSSSSSSTITEDTKLLCGLIKKYARGMKKGTVIDPKFKMRLKTYLT